MGTMAVKMGMKCSGISTKYFTVSSSILQWFRQDCLQFDAVILTSQRLNMLSRKTVPAELFICLWLYCNLFLCHVDSSHAIV